MGLRPRGRSGTSTGRLSEGPDGCPARARTVIRGPGVVRGPGRSSEGPDGCLRARAAVWLGVQAAICGAGRTVIHEGWWSSTGADGHPRGRLVISGGRRRVGCSWPDGRRCRSWGRWWGWPCAAGVHRERAGPLWQGSRRVSSPCRGSAEGTARPGPGVDPPGPGKPMRAQRDERGVGSWCDRSVSGAPGEVRAWPNLPSSPAGIDGSRAGIGKGSRVDVGQGSRGRCRQGSRTRRGKPGRASARKAGSGAGKGSQGGRR